MFEVNNRSITNKLGCMTSINIWQENVVYDKLTINDSQKKYQVFSSMLNEVRQGCPSQSTLQALKERVITSPTVKSCCLQTSLHCASFRHVTHAKSSMLSKLDSEAKEIPCVDEVDETQGTLKWSEKANKSLKN